MRVSAPTASSSRVHDVATVSMYDDVATIARRAIELLGGMPATLVCCRLVQVDPLTIGHLGLGVTQLRPRLPHLVGEPVDPRPPLALPRVRSLYRFAFCVRTPHVALGNTGSARAH